MVKYMVIIVGFSIMQYVYAMNQPCYLAYMPSDVRNRIAYFVICDGEEPNELIARIKYICKPAPEYDEFLLTTKNVFRVSDHKPLAVSRYTLRAFSPYSKYVALLRVPWISDANSILTIIDNIKKEVISIDENIPKGDYMHIALSPCARMLAIIERRKIEDKDIYISRHGWPKDSTKQCLILKNLINKSTTDITVLSADGNVASINFNMQGTAVVVCYPKVISNLEKMCTLISIISITQEKQKIGIVGNNSKVEMPTFQEYFEERRVCKSIEYSK